MQAIETRLLCQTAKRPDRITAVTASGVRVTLSIGQNGQRLEKDHRDAAKALCRKLGWIGRLVGGHTARGMVWVFAATDDRFTA